MQLALLHDRPQLEAFLRRQAALRVYELGDLDALFWPLTTWYGLMDGQDMREVALGYNAGDLLVLLATGADNPDDVRTLLQSIKHLLPRRFYAHFGVGMASEVAADYQIDDVSLHYKMALTDVPALEQIDTNDSVHLSQADQAEVLQFYADSYPGNWFDPRMLATNQYYGIREHGVLQCVAGVHVYSPQMRVAALGNIATRPSARGRGLATRASARLCRELLQTVDLIGLNVYAQNAAAIACYQRLGFTIVGAYEELMAVGKVKDL